MIDPYARFRSPLDHDATTTRIRTTVAPTRRRHRKVRTGVTVPRNMDRPTITGNRRADALYTRP